MSDFFIDRYGRRKFADDVIPEEKTGYFAVLCQEGRVLLTCPPQAEVWEFPGGGQKRQEDFRACLFRKLHEESGIELMLDKSGRVFEQEADYYADDEDGGFYRYHQVFLKYDCEKYGLRMSEEIRKTPENGWAVWAKIKDVAAGNIKMNVWHLAAAKNLLSDM